MCWMVTHKKMGEVFFALVRNGTLITFTQTKLIVQLIVHFFYQLVDFKFWCSTCIWCISSFKYPYLAQRVIRGSFEVDYLAVIYIYAHLYKTPFPGKIVKSNRYRYILFQEKKKTMSIFHHFFLASMMKKLSIYCHYFNCLFLSILVKVSQVLCTQGCCHLLAKALLITILKGIFVIY